MHVVLLTNIFKVIFGLTIVGQCFSVDTPPPIRLHAPLLDQTPLSPSSEGTSQSASVSNNPPMKISTGRMKAVTSPGSPRLYDANTEAGVGTSKQMKSISHVAVLSNAQSEHLYPKISVRPGRKDSTVVSFFRHSGRYPEGGKPYEYMQHQSPDTPLDISQPAIVYKVGLRKFDRPNSTDRQHASSILRYLGRNQYHPKAALVSTVPGDSRARRKGPKIDIDPGKLHGEILTTVHAPNSPPRQIQPVRQHPGQAQASNNGGSQSPPRGREKSRSPSPGGNKRQRTL